MKRSSIPCFFVLLALVACGDDGPSGPGEAPGAAGTLRGTYRQADDGQPYGPAPVDLFDLNARAVIDRTSADSSGVFVFREIPDGDYIPVLTSDDVAPFALPRARYVFDDGGSYDDVIFVAPLPVQLTPEDVGIAGTIVDDASGAPIPFARVEMNSTTGGTNWSQRSGSASEFRGHTTLQEVTADADGAFRIVPVSKIIVPVSDQPPIFEVRHPSWRVVAPGYRSRSFPSEEIDGIHTFEVRLERGADDAVITGRVVGPDGLPRAGVPVLAEWRRGAGELFRSGTPDMAAIVVGTGEISDSEGRFRIASIPEGAYNVLVGVEPDDGWVGRTLAQGVDVTGTTDVGDLEVVPAIAFEDLPPTATRGDTLRWTPAPAAASYEVTFRRGLDLQAVAVPGVDTFRALNLRHAVFDTTALLRLEIEALDAEGALIARTDRPVLLFWDLEPDL